MGASGGGGMFITTGPMKFLAGDMSRRSASQCLARRVIVNNVCLRILLGAKSGRGTVGRSRKEGTGKEI